ncbi:MAG: DegT/DnrJ/EryC1/StrS family aminotransferase [Sedimentisphaerales bacterium]|nr:DegT/DnrJ/EryC1/StrS family aminotransferase [Sedimentisphaerales bacterium]
MNRNQNNLTRRQFLTAASAGAVVAAASQTIPAYADITKNAGKLAALGGQPVRSGKGWPRWPHVDDDVVDSVVKTTKSRIWCRIQSKTGTVPTFEKKYAEMMGAKHFLATGSGTQALHTAVEAMGIGPGDEVITSPYTDPGTIASILAARALPVLADLDRYSYQIDPDDVERRINENTKAIMPVHIMGNPAHMERFMQMARKYNLKIIEDACQAHLAVYQGRLLGTIGDVGCFSFQSSKVISCGEGGGIVGNNDELMDKCYTIHNHGTSRRGRTELPGPKYRMNEFEAAVLLGQLPTARQRHERRNENARYLTSKIKDIPGISPQKLYEGSTEGSWYLYTMSYDKKHFNNVSRSKFIKALSAEGVDLSPYIKNGLHKEPWVDHILNQKVYQKMYSPQRLQQYRDENQCPNCDIVCREEMLMLWASGPLLGTKEDMDDIINAITKVYENRDKLDQV